ncbi:DNA-binding transcriptional MocR family regulator [Nakamurella sp. UYEF19]|uniref:MocR-like transcription factor YczR n=1 Tax=Nakamurella sp. UYEF19 TaxID=1756392 RepID=UPI0033962A2C
MTPESTARISAATLARRLGPEPVDAAGPAYRLLAHRIRSAVLDGRLAVTSGLPSERDLASGLQLSRTTVAAAYTLLRDEGWLDSRRGSGSRLRLPETGGPPRTTGDIGPAGLFGYPGSTGDEIDLSVASLPAPEGTLERIAAAAVADLPAYAAGGGYAPFGLPVLRQAIADHYSAAGLATTAEQILVTNGGQHAFTLALQELSVPGDRVMIECPTYPVALDAIRAARRIPGPIGLPGPGQLEDTSAPWDADLIAATMRQTAPRLAYLIPDFQNPTGALMDGPTRARIVEAAQASNTILLIDESFRDVPFPGHGALPPRMGSFDDGHRVLTLGSLSKSVWGGLRIGWLRGAPAVINRLAATRALGDMSGPVLEQLMAAHFLADPTAALDQQSRRLADGAAVLTAELAAARPEWKVSHPRGGASLWVALPGPFATELARSAHAVGVRIAPGPRFGPDGTMESYLRLPFTQPADKLVSGIRRLSAVADRAAAARLSDVPGWLT